MKTARIIVSLTACLSSLASLPVEAAPGGPPQITPDFLDVLRSGNVQRLRAALDHGTSANARDAQGNTPLMLAAVYSDASCVRLLLDRGAEVNVANAAGATPLMRAAGDYEKTRLLVERGADLNARSALGNTALMLAARPANSHRTVELLLARGADAKATNNWGATALMAAAAGGDARSVKLLLEHGAAVNSKPIVDHVGFIFGGGRSALMWAAHRGNSEIIKLLLDAGADVNGEGFLGTALAQTAWTDDAASARLLIERGAQVNQVTHFPDYAALHWAASSEHTDAALVNLLLKRGANPNLTGGAQVDAFVDDLRTPLKLAQYRGETAIARALLAGGASAESPAQVSAPVPPTRQLPARLDAAAFRSAVNQAIPPLQESSIFSKHSFVNHASRQDCTSCHQQYLPLAAISVAKRARAEVNADSEKQLLEIVHAGELKSTEVDWQALFHPEPAFTKGYTLFAWAAAGQPADEFTDAAVHHLATIQAKDGRWLNNLPRPPIQTSDVGATALAIHALQKYPLPWRKAEFGKRVARASEWLRGVKPENNEERVFQLLGLAWAGESKTKLQPLAKSLLAQQEADGGWAQLPGLKSDAYAPGEGIYALRVAAGLANSGAALERGRRYLLQTQLEDGTWFVHRRAFPFQPTMRSGFPHGRDGWVSAAATSWAVMALSLPDEIANLAAAGEGPLASRAK